jgi:hypothetical protein
MRGNLYLDWLGAKYEASEFFSQLSTRLKIDLIRRRGEGWTLALDTRDRIRFGEGANHHQLLLYNARLSYEKQQSRLFFSLGQMNLYDTAGIGQLFGTVLGYKLKPDLLLGGYAGLESSVYIDRLNNDYQKFGVFARYLGSLGKRFSLSYNHVRYSGTTERQYVYASAFYPVKKSLVLYGNFEYELSSNINNADRLSRIFLNARWDPIQLLDITANYSSGRGLDYHRQLIESSQNPALNDRKLERFYYSRYYGIRFSLKPSQGSRIYIGRQESEQRDDNVRNHTWRFGGSILNILKSGITAYGSYSINRGQISESDAYYISLTKDFGRLSWNVSVSNTFNGIRYDHSQGTAQLVHLSDYKTISTYFFIPISSAIAAAFEYEYFIQESSNQHLFFVRLMFRK